MFQCVISRDFALFHRHSSSRFFVQRFIFRMNFNMCQTNEMQLIFVPRALFVSLRSLVAASYCSNCGIITFKWAPFPPSASATPKNSVLLGFDCGRLSVARQKESNIFRESQVHRKVRTKSFPLYFSGKFSLHCFISAVRFTYSHSLSYAAPRPQLLHIYPSALYLWLCCGF